MNKISLGLIVCLLFASFGRTAQAAPDPTVLEARKHFEEGTKAFNLGEFDRAVKEYKAAYNAKPDPVFLYNIAQAYRLANDLSQALFFYRSFLRNQPNTPNRKEIEERIHQLEEQIAQQRVITTAPPTTTVAPGTLPPAAPVEPAPHAATAPSPTPPASTTSAPSAPAPAPTPAPSAPEPSATTAAPGATLTAKAPAKRADKPLYKKGWFWGVVVGSVVVVAGVGAGVGIALTRGGGVPSTDLGNAKAFLLGGGK